VFQFLRRLDASITAGSAFLLELACELAPALKARDGRLGEILLQTPEAAMP
jgi:hypothetical protein